MTRIGHHLTAAAIAAVLAVPAFAQPQAQPLPMMDEASGLAVLPPPGYAVRPISPNRTQTARFEVKKPDDRDTGCQVAFSPAPQNSRFSQSELDRVMRGKEWQETARTAIGGLYDVRETATIDGKVRVAFVMVGDFQDRPGLPPRARQVRTLFVIQETPRGRTSTVCVGERENFETRRAEFTEIATTAGAP